MNYYNEHDPAAAAWLRELIKAGEIPPGDVDERSIIDVKPDELRAYAQCHFFAGIGGWSRALRLAGWPDDRPVYTGSCPCQPLSCAGLGKGHVDERHLWPAFFALVAERRPATVFGEQVASKDGREWFAGVRADLEGVGYACGAADLCSAGVGSPNIRQRLYWVAESLHAERRTVDLDREDGRDRADGRREETRLDFGVREQVRGLADADGGEPGYGGLQRGGEHGQRAQDGGVGRMGSPILPGLEGHPGDVDDGDQSGRVGADAARPVAQAGAVSGSIWSGSKAHLCRDGKLRRVPLEPGLFPLASRIPGRVALLRGAGNAINPVLAAEFIKATR